MLLPILELWQTSTILPGAELLVTISAESAETKLVHNTEYAPYSKLHVSVLEPVTITIFTNPELTLLATLLLVVLFKPLVLTSFLVPLLIMCHLATLPTIALTTTLASYPPYNGKFLLIWIFSPHLVQTPAASLLKSQIRLFLFLTTTLWFPLFMWRKNASCRASLVFLVFILLFSRIMVESTRSRKVLSFWPLTISM